jgi:hypothetical protein
MTKPNPDHSTENDAPDDTPANCAILQGELSDAALDEVSGGRIINTVTTRPSGSGGTDGGTTGATNTTTSSGGLTIDVLLTPAAPSPIPIPYPNLKI